MLLGIATGLLWAPCAGPVLGLILTGAALQGANVQTTFLLLAYAAGAATSLALALLIGGRVFTAMKRSLGAGEWVRRGLGAAVLAAVVAIFFGLDTGFLTQVSLANTASLEQGLVDRFHPAEGKVASSVVMPEGGAAMMSANPSMRMSDKAPTMAMNANPAGAMMKAAEAPASKALPVEGTLPSLAGAVEWLNSPPLTPRAKGQGGAGRLLDLFLHQLPALDPLRPRLGRQVQGSGPGGDRRARAGIRLREKYRAT